MLDDLVWRGFKAPGFVTVDGAPGLEKALGLVRPDELVQRCTSIATCWAQNPGWV